MYLCVGKEQIYFIYEIMAKRKTLKHNIKSVCSELFAECLTMYLIVQKDDEAQIESLLKSIVALQREYASRAGHIEPGMAAQTYYNVLVDDFSKQVEEILGNIQALA